MEYKYCRREDAAGKLCGKKISAANPMHWCDSCRERLPFWPRSEAPATKKVKDFRFWDQKIESGYEQLGESSPGSLIESFVKKEVRHGQKV